MKLNELERLAKKAAPSLPSAKWIDYAAWIGVGGNPQCCVDDGRQKAFRSYIAACSPEVILALVKVAKAAQSLHDSAHNGNLYTREYNALSTAIEALRD